MVNPWCNRCRLAWIFPLREEAVMRLAMRPLHCPWCVHIYHGFEPVAKVCDIDLKGKLDTKENVISALKNNPIEYVFGVGHGSPDKFTGEHLQPIFTPDNIDILKNKHVYLHSCLTASYLGKKAMEAGVKSYAGFIIEWMWAYTPNEAGGIKYKNPLQDPQAKYFFLAQNTYPLALAQNKTPEEAYKETIDAYNKYIDELMKTNNKYAGQIIGLLAVDRDGFTLLSGLAAVSIKPSLIEVIAKTFTPIFLFSGVVAWKGKT